MADALVSALVETVLQSLNSVVVQEICLAWGLKNELNSLESILDTILLVFQDAEVKQRKNEVLRNWLRKLKNVAYDAEDILDEIATQGLRRTMDSERGKHHKLNSFLSLPNPLLLRFRVAHKVKNIRERLDVIAEERLKFHLREGIMDHQVENRQQTSSLVNESEIYGRHEEKETIVEKLLGTMSTVQDDLSVYALCGMGGMGKTTLAQLVYNDSRIDMHFKKRIWVCVSDDFDIRRLIKAVIESIGGDGSHITELDPLQSLLRERLMGQRYLLVLDDVWNENYKLWDELKEILRCGSKGSVLMVTTRIEKVAMMIATFSIHRLQTLSEDDSWSLFRRRAFANGEEDENLKEIGKGIVKKCGGVPLAVKALGSLMRYKSSEREWLAIKESEIWHLSDDENGILPALRLSYDNLPLQMRQCFSYCCIFPKDYRMEELHLIQLWMANGFISSQGQTDLLLNGHLMFKELVWRSFFQEVGKDHNLNVVCKMHDLVHDLALSVMKHEMYSMENEKVLKFPRTFHHLSSDWTSRRVIPENKAKLKMPINKSLRSIVLHQHELPVCIKDFSSFLSKQRHLRVLDSRFYSIQKLPNFVSKMGHLRFLTMACYDLKKLPESLTYLYNLQTLKLMNSYMLLELPKGLKYMKKLCFIEIEHINSLVCTPPGIGELSCLQELSIFIVGQDSAHQIGQLKDLNLGGKLSITELEHINNFESAKSANLMTKKNLTSLSLHWTKDIIHGCAKDVEEVLEGLQPHKNLEKISIEFYQGQKLPTWMSMLCNNLKEIRLFSCGRCEHLPPLGKLPFLSSLRLSEMKLIKCLNDEMYGDGETLFPALTKLVICNMPNLDKWTTPDSVESFPCLMDLSITGCPKLSGFPFLPTLKHLMIMSNNNMAFLRSMIFLTSLASLVLRDMSEINILPGGFFENHKYLESLQIGLSSIKTLSYTLGDLCALKRLSIGRCPNLEVMPDWLKNLDSLESLDISYCDSLTSFPATILQGSSLRSLQIQNCKKLISPLSGPVEVTSPTLQDLLINGCPELKLIPESMKQLSGLRELRIWYCKGLSFLPNWLGNFESLSVLKIRYCINLKALPDGFVRLKSLQVFEVKGCPILLKRCKKPKGVDWPKISHVPNIYMYDL